MKQHHPLTMMAIIMMSSATFAYDHPMFVSSPSFHKWHHSLIRAPHHMQRANKTSISSAATSSSSYSNGSRHNRKVAILLPDTPDDDTDENTNWQMEATCRLNEIANHNQQRNDDEEGTSIITTISSSNGMEEEEQQQQQAEYYDYTHYLTAVSYPRANSYALAIQQQLDGSSSNNRRRNNNKKKKRKLKLTDPFYIDLCPPIDTLLGYRIMSNNNDGGGGEMLLKALNLKKLMSEKKRKQKNTEGGADPLIIYDLTAGLARDTLVILSSLLQQSNNSNSSDDSSDDHQYGLKLHMVERDPIVALLLSDAMRRLHLLTATTHDANEEEDGISGIAKRIAHCLSMEEGDGVTVLNTLVSDNNRSNNNSGCCMSPDICYLDPMFPPRKKKKSSAVKKDMALLHSLLGTHIPSSEESDKENDDEDDAVARLLEERELLLAAINSAMKRVVVKRPIYAQPLGLSSCDGGDDDEAIDINIPKPSYDVRGSVNRFDVYIIS